MKINLILSLLIAAAFLSCEEGFEPTTGFRQDYVMYAIIDGDSTYQSVVITKSYQADNFDPYSNTEDPDIKNAVITITGNGKEYILTNHTIQHRNIFIIPMSLNPKSAKNWN